MVVGALRPLGDMAAYTETAVEFELEPNVLNASTMNWYCYPVVRAVLVV